MAQVIRTPSDRRALATFEPVLVLVVAAVELAALHRVAGFGRLAWCGPFATAALGISGMVHRWLVPGAFLRALSAVVLALPAFAGPSALRLHAWLVLVLIVVVYSLLLIGRERRWLLALSSGIAALGLILAFITADPAAEMASATLLAAVTFVAMRVARLFDDGELRNLGHQRERRLLSALLQDTNDVVVVTGPDRRIVFVTQPVERVLGYRPAELLGATMDRLVHPDDLEHYRQASAVVRRGVGRSVGEVRVRHRSGEWRWMIGRATNLLDDDVVRGVVTSWQDCTERREAVGALAASESLFRTIAETSLVPIVRIGADGRVLFANSCFAELVGIPVGSVADFTWAGVIHPDDREAVLGERATLLRTRQPLHQRFRILHPQRGTRWIEATTAALFEGDAFVGFAGTCSDVTDRLHHERMASRLSAIVEATTDLVAIGTLDRNLVYVNGAARRFLGLPDVPLDRMPPVDSLDWFTAASQQRIVDEITPVLLADGLWSGELELLARDGRVVPVSMVFLTQLDEESGGVTVVAISRDLTDRKELEVELAYRATHDPLTGLPNREVALDRLEVALARARRSNRSVAVLFCDVDNFKVVNDSLGHVAGDELLVHVAWQLRRTVRPGDTVARLGGDEFVVLCEDIEDDTVPSHIAARMLAAVGRPTEVGVTEVVPTISIGIAFAGPNHTRASDLLRDADVAMYRAKDLGRNRSETFDPLMGARALVRLDTEQRLRRALERNELRLLYQPKVMLDTTRILGFEALLRWEHPERGLLAPVEFIDLAEETGIIVDIGSWALREATAQLRRWQDEFPDLRDLEVGVNLSARQLAQPSLVDDVKAAVDAAGIDPTCLDLEITESAAMADAAETADLLRRLKQLGVRLSIDDFGTGYSSLSYLQRFPVDVLKIDRSFIDAMTHGPEGADIVRLVIALGNSLGLVTVAEGVETDRQRLDLLVMGCTRAQGYWFAPPVTAADAELLLATQG